MRGWLYEILTEKVDLFGMESSIFYDCQNRFCEWQRIADDSDRVSNNLIENLKKYGFETGIEAESDGEGHVIRYFVPTKDSIKKYFETNYKQFVDLTKEITLADFAKEQVAGRLEDLLCDNYADMVYEGDCDPKPIDEFFRTVIPGVRYYIGNVIELH